MPRYELTIKADYLPTWGVWQGVRELIQNARDGAIQDEAPFSVAYKKRRRFGREVGAIVIKNEGTTIPRQALLVGHTTKAERSDLIGQFGEGFKFGLLALIRAGVEVKIRNGAEVWNPLLVQSATYHTEVLAFDVSTGLQFANRIQIEVVGITDEQWEEIKSKLLFIGKMPKHVECSNGEVLLDPAYKGKMFVKGMFVSDTEMMYGYNFKDADIDRDRRMISNRQEKTAELLAQAINQGRLVKEVYNMMHERADEADYISGWRLNDRGREALAAAFRNQYPNTIPTSSDDEVTELGHLGKRGVKVSYALQNILTHRLGSAQEIIKALRFGTSHHYDLQDLTEQEQTNLQQAVHRVRNAARQLGLQEPKTPTIVDFKDAGLCGTFDPSDQSIKLARGVLCGEAQTLRTYIHEAAHACGSDGEKPHENTIGNLTEKVLGELLRRAKELEEVLCQHNNDN